MDRVEEVNELANIENDENVECPVDANFADDWRNSNISIPNNNHGHEVEEQDGDQADDQLEQGDEQTEDEEVEVLGGDQDEVEVRGGDQDEVEEQDGDQADKQLELLRKGE